MAGDVIPTTWTELLEAIYAESWNEQIQRHRSRFALRGLANSTWQMPSSLIRLGGNFAVLEKHLLRNFRKYAHRDVAERDSFWHWLTVAQHHGLPTRLVDWTFSPFVALHFATCDLSHMGDDGVVWCVDIEAVHKKLPKPLRSALQAEGSIVFTVDMLSAFELPEISLSVAGISVSSSQVRLTKINDLQDLDKLTKRPFALFLEPPSIDDRIVNQYAMFSVVSDAVMRMDEWLEHHPSLWRRVVIPAALKWEVRDKLDQANMTERVLFPGLDGLSTWLKRHYSPRT